MIWGLKGRKGLNIRKKAIFVLGGIRSGKTRYAIEKIKAYGKNIVYIATNIFYDDEMKKRIALHKTLRPKEWRTIEEGKDLIGILNGIVCDGTIIDCLGVFVTNLMMDGVLNGDIESELKNLANAIVKAPFPIILVSNDVGCSIVPENPLGRRFCDLMGIANQIMAEKLNSVVFLHAGIPIIIKGGNENVRRNH